RRASGRWCGPRRCSGSVAGGWNDQPLALLAGAELLLADGDPAAHHEVEHGPAEDQHHHDRQPERHVADDGAEDTHQKSLLFLKKKKQKDFCPLALRRLPPPREPGKVLWFFLSRKNTLPFMSPPIGRRSASPAPRLRA